MIRATKTYQSAEEAEAAFTKLAQTGLPKVAGILAGQFLQARLCGKVMELTSGPISQLPTLLEEARIDGDDAEGWQETPCQPN